MRAPRFLWQRRIDSLPRRRLFCLSFPPWPGPERELAGAEEDHWRGLAPAPRRRGRRTGGEKARVPSRLLASYGARGLPVEFASLLCVWPGARVRVSVCSPRPGLRSILLRPSTQECAPAPATAKPRGGHRALPREVRRPRAGGGRGGGEGTLPGTHTHPAISRECQPEWANPPSDPWPAAAPRPPPSAVRWRRDPFPPSLHLTIFQAPQLG